MMTRRWTCPNCGSGLNAPERMRKNDVRRYCQTCSWSTGYLVERTAPALERRRAAGRERTRIKTQAKREKARQAKLTKLRNARGEEVSIDLVRETRRALREMGYVNPDSVEVIVRRRRDGSFSGHASPYSSRVVLSANDSLEDVLVMVYHEAAHVAAGYDRSDTRHWHGEKFQRTLANALQGRWPFLTYGSIRGRDGYAPGWRVRAQLKEHVRNGGEL